VSTLFAFFQPRFCFSKHQADLSRRVLDGELQNTFEFHTHESTSSAGFPDMTITFNMFYDDEIFHFKAIKTADLDTTDLGRLTGLEQEWKTLHNPDHQYKIEYEERKDDVLWSERKRLFPINRKRKVEYVLY